MRFANKVVVVTGAARGIGAAVARRFADERATVVLLDLENSVGEATAQSLREAGASAAGFIACNVADEASVQAAVAEAVSRHGRIDALVNCAGITGDASTFLDVTSANWSRVLDVNVKGSFLVGQTVARVMVGQGGGAIVNIASINGHGAEPDCAAYCASKSAIYGLTRAAAVELGVHGVRVNSVSPGYVDTPMLDQWFGLEKMRELRGGGLRRVPMKRFVKPEEIAAVCAFLASDDASAVSGADLVVDAGTMADAYVLQSV